MDETVYRRLEELEAQVMRLSQHLGVACPPFASTGWAAPAGGPSPAPGVGPAGPAPMSPAQAEILQLARSGKTIEAIKRYRELTGSSLAEAKQAVDNMV